MAIKTAAEMFGDGGGFGPAVPYSTANPPGTSAGNRGIQFGEQLTAAISNRPHYALALNDEDLNMRLASFETGGLNAAYDLGTLGPAGGGRSITIDAGAVALNVANTAMYGQDIANAGLRVSNTGASINGVVGVEHVSNGGAYSHFLGRRRGGGAGDTTDLSGVGGATLNVGGAGATRITTTTPGTFFHVSGATELMLGVDMLEISGAPGYNGLYIIHALGPTDTTAELRRLDGSSPVFPANTACTYTPYRPTFATGDQGTSQPVVNGGFFAGAPEASQPALLVIGGASGILNTSGGREYGGSTRALRIGYRALTGAVSTATEFDTFGRLSFETPAFADELEANREQVERFGNYAVYIDKTGQVDNTYETGLVVAGYDTGGGRHRLDIASLLGAETALVGSLGFGFDTNSPLDGTISINSGISFGNESHLGPGAVVEILTPTSRAGFYMVSSIETHNPDDIQLMRLDGAVPAFPTSGTGTARVHTLSALGRLPQLAVDSLEIGATGTVTPASLLTANPRYDDSAAGVFVTPSDEGSRRHHAWRALAMGEQFAEEIGSLDSGGNLRVRGDFLYGPNTYGTSVLPLRTKEINLELGVGQGWTYNSASPGAGLWTGLGSSEMIHFPIDLPNGATLVSVQIMVVTDDSDVLFVRRLASNWGTPGARTVTNLGSASATAASPTHEIVTVSGLSEVVDNSANTYQVAYAPQGAVTIRAVRYTFRDPGPRNF
jgi:hypothetical protein